MHFWILDRKVLMEARSILPDILAHSRSTEDFRDTIFKWPLAQARVSTSVQHFNVPLAVQGTLNPDWLENKPNGP